jgi:hypothetical protein
MNYQNEMNFPNFRKLVNALQAVSGGATIAKFLYCQPLGQEYGKLSLRLQINFIDIVPLVEAIAMRLKWCQEQSIDRLPPSPQKPFSGDAVLDASRLLLILEHLMEELRENFPIRKRSIGLTISSLNEVLALSDQVLDEQRFAISQEEKERHGFGSESEEEMPDRPPQTMAEVMEWRERAKTEGIGRILSSEEVTKMGIELPNGFSLAEYEKNSDILFLLWRGERTHVIGRKADAKRIEKEASEYFVGP